jgi:hypothetical protein
VAAAVSALAWNGAGQAANPPTTKSTPSVSGPPRLFLADGRDLAQVKALFKAGDRTVVADVKQLRALANKAMTRGPYSVVHSKPRKPADAGAHDYVSLSIYVWPDPSKKDGLPYKIIDGKKNKKEASLYDEPLLVDMSTTVELLALAYYLTDEEPFAQRSARLLRAWFLDPATRMNPNMKFDGFVPGKNKGAGTGLIDARNLNRVIDAVGLLQHSRAWTRADQKGIETWYRQFLNWLLTSKLGKEMANTPNNQGTWYDVDAVTMALFIGDKTKARAILTRARSRRIAAQIAPDGSQPKELARKDAFNYSLFNLEPLFDLATLGEHAGVDLWRYHTQDGRSIRKALDFLVPYATQKKKWPYSQLSPIPYSDMAVLLRRAGRAYRDRKYEQAIGQLPGGTTDLGLVDRLLYPTSGK